MTIISPLWHHLLFLLLHSTLPSLVVICVKDPSLLSRRALEASQGITVPAGSNMPGVNYCDPTFFPTHMEQCYNHYAAGPDYEMIDKKGMSEMAKDCVATFIQQIKLETKKEHSNWNDVV